MRYFLFITLVLTACVGHKPSHFMTVTLTAVEASYQKGKDDWGLLRLDSVDHLSNFQKEKKRGSMRVEDFFSAWHLNGHTAEGTLTFAGTKRHKTLSVRLRQAEYDPLHEELTLMVQPLDSKGRIPAKMEAVELTFYIEADDQTFWDKWMGL